MKRIKSFALVLAMLLIITGCSPGDGQIVLSGQNEEIGTTVSDNGSSTCRPMEACWPRRTVYSSIPGKKRWLRDITHTETVIRKRMI